MKFIDRFLARWGYAQRLVETTQTDAAAKRNVFKPIFMKFKAAVGSRNAELKDPEYDFKSVRTAVDVESILRQAKEKYVQLMWKNGFAFIGKNQKAVEYIQMRLAQIALVTNTPTAVLLDAISEEMVTYHNVYLAIQRDASTSGGKPYVNLFGKRVNPIAGIFSMPASHASPMLDQKSKRLLAWKFDPVSDDQDEQFFLRDEVIHMYMSRAIGNIQGTPAIIPVLDDVRALRRMEQSAETLIFQHAIPLYQYKVGTADMPEVDQGKFDEIKSAIESSDPHGMFVVPFDHDITAVGMGDSPLDVTRYLSYFRLRVISGLGLSTVVFGESDSSNRGTAQVQDKGLQDGAKKYLSMIKTFFDEMVINELLQEGGFDIMDPQDKVHLFTPEIDIDTKMKKETHIMSLYHGNCISENEMRTQMGLETVSETEREFMHFQLIEIPKAVIGAGDEKYIPESGAPASKPKAEGALKIAKGLANKVRPQNQNGVKINSKPAANKASTEEFLLSVTTLNTATITKSHLDGLMGHMVEIMTGLKEHSDAIGADVGHRMTLMREDTTNLLRQIYDQGVENQGEEESKPLDPVLARYKEFLHEMENDATILLDKLQSDKLTHSQDGSHVNAITANDVVNIFDTLRHRLLRTMPDILRKSFNAGAGKEE